MTIRLALLALALLLMPTGAEARECARYGIRLVHREFPYHSYRERYCRYWTQGERYRLLDEHAYRDDEREPARVKCLFNQGPLKATGDDKLEERNAEVSAQDRWSIEVETNRGTIYSDIRFAADMRVACVRKAPTTATEKGQALAGIRHYACTVSAVPCAAPNEPKEEDDRAKRKFNDPDPPATPAARIERYDAPPPPKRRFWQRRD